MYEEAELDWDSWTPWVNPELVDLRADAVEHLRDLDDQHGGTGKVIVIAYTLEIAEGNKGQPQEVVAASCLTEGVSNLDDVPAEFVSTRYGMNLLFRTKKDFHDTGAARVGVEGNKLTLVV